MRAVLSKIVETIKRAVANLSRPLTPDEEEDARTW